MFICIEPLLAIEDACIRASQSRIWTEMEELLAELTQLLMGIAIMQVRLELCALYTCKTSRGLGMCMSHLR